ncbi:MAG: PEP-CTERM sorting domain-containing protein [Burkholderiaceae bacterium]
MNATKTLLASALLLAAGAASAATTVDIAFQGMNGIELTTSDSYGYLTGAMQYTTGSGTSFEAFCVELAQGYAPTSYGLQNYSVGSFSGLQSSLLQGLFSSSYAGLASAGQKAAFQTAVWEITHETSGTLNAAAGSFKFEYLSASSTVAEDAAFLALTNGYLAAASTYTGAAKYTLTRLDNPVYQDVLTVTAVPEPASYAMLLAGLGAIGFVAGRRRQR